MLELDMIQIVDLWLPNFQYVIEETITILETKNLRSDFRVILVFKKNLGLLKATSTAIL